MIVKKKGVLKKSIPNKSIAVSNLTKKITSTPSIKKTLINNTVGAKKLISKPLTSTLQAITKSTALSSERIPSGVPGLDAEMEGGFEKNSAVLISGGGGSGKTILGLQFLLEGIEKFDETGVYISFEENKEKFYKHMLRFGWDLDALEKKGRFVFIKYSPEKMVEMVEMGGKTIGKELQEINGKRIVIDSLSAYTVLFEKESDQRKMLVNLFTMIESWDATTIVIAEENPDINKFHSSVMGFMADAIIYIYNVIHDNTLVRAMQIAKMRGTKHTVRIFPLMIEDSGITAYPDQEIFEHNFGEEKK